MAAFDTDVEVFQDLCHLNDVGVRRLADELVRHVPQWISRRPPVASLPRPEEFPPLGSPARVHLGAKSAADYLGRGWSLPEGSFRWTDGRVAVLRFGAEDAVARVLRLKAWPFLAGSLRAQRLHVSLNGRWLGDAEATASATYAWMLASGSLGEQNTLVLELPDAVSPADLGVSGDSRRLGFTVEWLELEPVTDEQGGSDTKRGGSHLAPP